MRVVRSRRSFAEGVAEMLRCASQFMLKIPSIAQCVLWIPAATCLAVETETPSARFKLGLAMMEFFAAAVTGAASTPKQLRTR